MNYYKKAEEYIKNYKALKIHIETLTKQLKEIEETGLKATSLEYTGRTGPGSTVENAILKMEREEEIIRAKINRVGLMVERIERAIETLNETERYIITERYIARKQWWQIAYATKYGERHCRRIRTEAIKQISICLFGLEAT